ncbi:uncharacterized protein LOC111359244 [Spodoptera litura]|uniref:Uncharacterized protein LOC111359244 n=1 Tax=Spodoptera litura TaxID=69820 RepID=A0A9J7EL21_SPOLT|nr:uncharacterized protein LOC111359244 [Spodoptera litura]
MHEDESRTVLINIIKPRRLTDNNYNNTVKLKRRNSIQTVKKRLKKASSVCQTCFVPDIEPLPAATLKKDAVLLPYVLYTRTQEKEIFRKRMNMGLRDSYKAVYAKIMNRIHIDDPPDDVLTVTGFDPGFFQCVSTTILSKYIAPYKSLKYSFNTQLRLRQECGYRNDCMLNIESNFKREQETYDEATQRYMEQVKYFEAFILADYLKSMVYLNKWEELALALNKVNFEYQCLAAKMFTITSRIVGLDYRYGLQQKYGRCLYYLSPPSWRYKNRNFARSVEIEAKGFDFGISKEEDTFSVMFEKLQMECYGGLVKPVLYFDHAADLMKLFDGIEQQHLHHFTHVVQLAPHTTFLKKGIKLFNDIIAQDSAGILAIIKEFKKLLEFSEDQGSQLEAKFYKIINGFFYDCVGAPEVLKFQLHLEFCYEKIHNEKPINMDLVGTAKALEDFYMDYSKRLDAVTGEKIKAAMAVYINSERQQFKEAKDAAKELRQFRRLELTLLRAHALPSTVQPNYNFTRNLSLRKKKLPKTKCEEYRNSLTEGELEYLTLFTDWTELEDPANYLQCRSMSHVDTGHTNKK